MSIADKMIRSALCQYIYSPQQQEKFQNKELHRLVRYAREHSPYLRELYRDVGEEFQLTDLPITNKQMMMEHYDLWTTDPEIKLRELQEFVKDPANIGRRYKGKYLVASTSGSTGYPLHYPMNSEMINVSTCTALLSKALKKRPVALVFPGNLFLIATGAIHANMRRYPHIMKKNYRFVDAMLPPEEIAAQLNEIQPRTIYGYSTLVESIAEQAERGNLHISVEEAICCSEMLTDHARQYIQAQLGCTTRSIYGCTETGNIGIDGLCGHMHLNNPYVIVELVDEHNQPVPPGQQAYKALVTSLCSDTLPIIRYELMDRLVLHTEGCTCGDHSPWVELEGRSGLQLLEFRGGRKVTPMLLYVAVEVMDTLRKFQIILHDDDVLEFRAIFMPGVDEAAVFREARQRILDYLATCGVERASVYLSKEEPAIDPVSHKFKSVFQVHDRAPQE